MVLKNSNYQSFSDWGAGEEPQPMASEIEPDEDSILYMIDIDGKLMLRDKEGNIFSNDEEQTLVGAYDFNKLKWIFVCF